MLTACGAAACLQVNAAGAVPCSVLRSTPCRHKLHAHGRRCTQDSRGIQADVQAAVQPARSGHAAARPCSTGQRTYQLRASVSESTCEVARILQGFRHPRQYVIFPAASTGHLATWRVFVHTEHASFFEALILLSKVFIKHPYHLPCASAGAAAAEHIHGVLAVG